MNWLPSVRTSSRVGGSAATSRSARIAVPPSPSRPSSAANGSGPDIGAAATAAIRAVSVIPASASERPPAEISTATSSGAPIRLALSRELWPALAAVSSSEVLTTLGSSAACAGRGTVIARFTNGTSANTSQLGASSATATATAAIATVSAVYAANSTRPGLCRSARAPSHGARIAEGTS